MHKGIVLEGVTKQYAGTAIPAVRDVELSVEPGEILALLGPSGCGKTTTLRLIAGFQLNSPADLPDDTPIASTGD